MNLPSLNTIRNKTVGQLFQASVQSKQAEKRLLDVNGELHNFGEKLPLCTPVSTFRNGRFIPKEIDTGGSTKQLTKVDDAVSLACHSVSLPQIKNLIDLTLVSNTKLSNYHFLIKPTE